MKKFTLLILVLVFNVNAQKLSGNWVLNIDGELTEYDKKAKVKMSHKDSVNKAEVETIWYKMKKDVFKIKQIFDLGYNVKIEYVYYYKNKLLVKNRIFGNIPKLYKKKKKENDPCCNIDEQVFYFKNEKQAVKKYRKLDLSYMNEYMSKLNEFKKLHFSTKIYDSIESKKLYDEKSNLINGLIIY